MPIPPASLRWIAGRTPPATSAADAPNSSLDDRVQFRVIAARTIARLGQRPAGDHDPARPKELLGLLQRGPAHGAHRRQYQHTIGSIGDMQSPVANLGPRQRLEIHEDEIVAVIHQASYPAAKAASVASLPPSPAWPGATGYITATSH